MIFYKYNGKILCSREDDYPYEKVDIHGADDTVKELYFLTKKPVGISKKSWAVVAPEDFVCQENLNDLRIMKVDARDRAMFEHILSHARVKAVNTAYPDYEECLKMNHKDKYRVNILALGDVGSTLLVGLRLLGRNKISEIGICDMNRNVVLRWEYELNQITEPFSYDEFPRVYGISMEELFDGDVFIFCASKGIPPVGSGIKDVRMAQFEQNASLVAQYARMARKKQFKGLFAVVSDPVDPLCKAAFLAATENERGELDYAGLAPEQVKGYGLGVMNARALFYADRDESMASYKTEGRAFGPHGEDLVIANSIEHYNDEVSRQLTRQVVEANMKVRALGFKPYVAPALSSGALSILGTLEGKWHYSSTFLGGVYMGAKNRWLPQGNQLERNHLPETLMERLKETYGKLEQII